VTTGENTSQHEAAESLPMITEGAEVVLAEPMDEDRRSEIATEVRQTLRNLDEEKLLDEAGEKDGIDWERLREAWDGHDPSDALTEKISTLRRRAQRKFPSLMRVRFREEDDTDIEFAPGQYVTLRYDETPRPYSVASSPNDDAIEMCVRRVPGGTLTSDLCDDIEVGKDVTLRGPNGDFTLQEPSERDMVFLCTGTGVAPFRSMITYTFEEGRDEVGGTERDLWLFLGTGWKDDVAYREEFERLAEERDNFHFVPTLSREEYLTDWEGETAYVQQTLLKYVESEAVADADLPPAMQSTAEESPDYDIDARINPDSAEVYACGTNVMVEGLLDAVRSVGVPDERVESEGYG
jgi:CDP-4-dehydro-6-deoxyglucose reductase